MEPHDDRRHPGPEDCIIDELKAAIKEFWPVPIPACQGDRRASTEHQPFHGRQARYIAENGRRALQLPPTPPRQATMSGRRAGEPF